MAETPEENSGEHASSATPDSGAPQRTRVRVRTGKKINRKKQRRNKLIKRWVGAIVLILIVCGAWLAVSGFMAAKAVNAAQSDISQLQKAMSSVSAQDQLADPKIASLLDQAADNTGKANFWTSGPVWWGAAQVPFVGNTFAAIRATVAGTDAAVSNALPVVVKSAQVAAKEKLRTSSGAFNLKTIQNTQEPLARATQEMNGAVAIADEAPASWVVPQIATQVTDANAELHQLQGQVDGLNTAAKVLPTVLGAQGKQSYFVAFTNPTEARAGGGFLGAYGILTANNGRVSLDTVESNRSMKDFDSPVLNLGPEYTSTYGKNPSLWRNMDLSPHFPYAAQQFIAGWNKQTGEKLDGALSVDVVTLAYLSEVTGPVTLPGGKKLKANQIVDYLTNGIYIEYEGRESTQDEVQVGIASRVADGLLTGSESPIALARPFARAASEGRLLFYSTNPEVETAIAGTPISGVIDNKPGPYAYLTVNNYSGNKIDYYLDRTLTYEQTSCTGGLAGTKVTTTLNNDVPAGKKLPRYIVGRADKGSDGKPAGTTKTSQLVLLPMGTEVSSVTLDGKDANYTIVAENGRPGVLVYTELRPRVPAILEIELTEPGSTEQPRIPVQPLVRDQKTVVSWTPCG